MKPQLLEDIGASQSPLDSPSDPVLRVVPNAPRPAPAVALPRSHFGVWRDRIPAAETAVPATPEPANEPVIEEPVAGPLHLDMSLPAPEPAPAPRRGRMVPWGTAALAVALLAGGSLWLYNDRKDAATLAMLATKLETAPAVVNATPLPAAVTPAVPAVPVQEKIPPLVLLKEEEMAEPKREPEVVAEVEAPVKAIEAVRAPVAGTTVRPVRKTREARPVAKAVVPRPVAKAAVPRSVAKVQRRTEVAPADGYAKACSALGYREAQCRKRACVLTKFGLACKG